MEPYRKIALALVIVAPFLMTGNFLRSAASTARIQSAPQMTVKSKGVDAKTTIKIPPSVDETQVVSTGEAMVESLLPGVYAAQYDNTALNLLGLQSMSTGSGGDNITISKIGDQYHVVCRSTVANVNVLSGAVTADRIVNEMSFDSNNGNITNLVKNVTFENLMVNGALMPNNPEPNTVIEFDREISILSISIPVRAKVTIKPESITTDGETPKARIGGIDVEIKNSTSLQGLLLQPRRTSSDYGEMILPYHQRAINTDYEFLVPKWRPNAHGEGIYRGVGKSFDLGGGLYGVSHHSSSQGITEYGAILAYVPIVWYF